MGCMAEDNTSTTAYAIHVWLGALGNGMHARGQPIADGRLSLSSLGTDGESGASITDGMRLQVTCGSADRMVFIWEVATRKLLYKLPGHTGSVNEAVFHPEEPIVCSASSDRQLFLGELTT